MVHAGVHNLAVDLDDYRAVATAEKAVQVTGHYLVACPAGNADVHGEVAGLAGVNMDLEFAIPGIAGLLLQAHVYPAHADVSVGANEQVDVQLVIIVSVDVLAERGD